MVTLQISAKELLLDKHDVAQMLRCTEQTITNLLREKDKKFPAPFKLSNYKSTPLWRLEDVKNWIDKHYAEQE